MRKTIKLISAIMCLVMLFGSALPISVSAVSEENSWSEYLEENKGVYISPGADDTEMRITCTAVKTELTL